jgi:hypothetical protein
MPSDLGVVTTSRPTIVAGVLGPPCMKAASQGRSPDRAAAVNAQGVAAEDAVTRAGGGRYADLADLFCTADTCL